MNPKEIDNSIINAIRNPDLEELTTDLSEIALDQLTEANGIAKDVPIIGTVLKIINIGFSIRDILFLRKLGKFLWYLKDVPLVKRKALIEKLEQDSEYRSDIGYKIFLLLDRADDLEKPEIIANAFKAYLEESISYSQLQRINYAVDHLYIGDIRELERFYQNPGHSMQESTHQNLELCGFVDLIITMGGGSKPTINELGIIFAEKVLLRK